MFFLNSCSYYKVFKTPQEFIILQEDPRIFYENGAKEKALYLASFLDTQIKHIEKEQYLSFNKTLKIYIFNTQASYEKYAVYKNSGGETHGDRKIIISPKKENSLKRLKGLLTHELSHFHIYSYLGLTKGYFLPTWLLEGLAVKVSNGTGAEKVSQQSAINALLSNKQFDITKNNSKPKNMKAHMFYRQSELFVQYLYTQDKQKFKRFLIGILNKKDIETTFKNIYKNSLHTYFKKFKIQLKEKHGTL